MPRPFCRATTLRNGAEHTCHRMAGHIGPHVERKWRQDIAGCRGLRVCWCSAADVRWFDVVAYTGPQFVSERAG